jgi:methylated-DNA-[protein]-cysteine S-methyltransferase
VEPSDDRTLTRLAEELDRYFAGEPGPFTVRLDLRAGTPFRQRVWRALRRIPFGHTVAYGALARRAGCPHGARAVGQAVGANPIGIVVPCHRVIRASGEFGGFGGGLPIKKWLLAHERALPTPC